MAVSSIKDFWIHPNALTITLNYFDDPQLIQTSMLAGSVIMAYRKDVISYDAAHNFREWKLQAFPTQLNDTCAYYVHAELSRSGDTAMIIYSPVKRDIEGRSYIDGSWNNTTSTESYFIYLGTISASVDNDGAKVERAWTDGFYTGTLDTDQQRMEEASGEWKTMFNYNDVIGQIEPQKPFSKIKVMGEAIFQSIAQFVNGLVIGKRTITDVAASSDSGNESKVSDATLPTTGYVQKEIESLDDHFLIKDGDDPQDVGGDVSFGGNVSVAGEHSVGGSQSIGGGQSVVGSQTIGRNQTIGGDQTVKGTVRISSDRSLGDMALVIGDYFEQGDIIQGAAVNKDGIASFARIKTPSMQVYELEYNRKTAVQGEFVFSDGDTLESITYVCDNGVEYTHEQVEEGVWTPYSEDRKTQNFRYIRAKVRAPYEGYTTTMKEYDILYSNINNIGASGESATTGKCFLRILADDEIPGVKGVEDDGITLNVMHYLDEYTPSRFNMLPTPHMTITRHGNRSDKTRQDLFIISSETSSLTMLRGVNAPIVSSEGLYGVVVGKLPKALLEYVNNTANYVNDEDPYVYARGVIVQDLIMLDYQGKPIPTERYRRDWSLDIAKGLVEGEDKYRKTGTLVDTVTHNGSLWQCMYDGTTAEPQDNSEYWLKKVSKGEDGDMPTIFTITSSLTSIHQDNNGSLNTNVLDIWVNAVGAPSNFEIKDQATLDSYGLSVWFNIDGQEDVRTKLIIGGADAIEVEEGGAIIVAEDDDDDGGAYITLESESIDISSVREKINIYLVRDADEEGFGVDENRMYIPVMRDGQRGRMLYPAGVYDSTKKYMIENNSAPFVKHQVLEGKPTYYVLIWEGGFVKGIEPGSVGSDKYWKPFTYMNYLFAEFLMANWAMFGSDKGAVFYDRFLFSQYGIDSNGMFQHFSNFVEDMFTEDGSLSGAFVPSLAIDMYQGYVKTNKLAETFQEFRYHDGDNPDPLYANEMRFNQTYNVKYESKQGPCLLTMPLSQDIKDGGITLIEAQYDTAIDGIRSIVVNKANRTWSAKLRAALMGTSTTIEGFESVAEAAGGALLLSSTPSLFNPYAWRYDSSYGLLYNIESDGSDTVSYEHGTFVVNGIYSRFLLIEPGMQAIMRSCKSDNILYWYVENSDDFVEVPYTVWVKMAQYYDGSLKTTHSSVQWQQLGADFAGGTQNANRCYVTKGIAELYTLFESTLNIDIISEQYSPNSMDEWHWEKCISSLTIKSKHNG